MKIIIQKWTILLVFLVGIRSECDMCQSSNFVACHSENQYSLCINGLPTKNLITCPENYVCTADPFVCYPLANAKPSCLRNPNLCGVCSDSKVYACTNETTIAFCYGEDKPLKDAEVSYCLGDTVCDIYIDKGFCTERLLVKPSCVTTPSGDILTTTTTKQPPTTIHVATESSFITTTTVPTRIGNISTQTTTTISMAEERTATRTTEPTTLIRTAGVSTILTVTEPVIRQTKNKECATITAEPSPTTAETKLSSIATTRKQTSEPTNTIRSAELNLTNVISDSLTTVTETATKTTRTESKIVTAPAALTPAIVKVESITTPLTIELTNTEKEAKITIGTVDALSASTTTVPTQYKTTNKNVPTEGRFSVLEVFAYASKKLQIDNRDATRSEVATTTTATNKNTEPYTTSITRSIKPITPKQQNHLLH